MGVLTSLIGGVAGYGTGALMPLVLVPIVGPEPAVPIIALAGLLTNTSRATAFLSSIDWRRALLVLAGATLPCIVSAYGYTLLTGKGAMLVIGTMLMLTVPLRYLLKRHSVTVGDRGLVLGSAGYGTAGGGNRCARVSFLAFLIAGRFVSTGR